ncbi:MAG: hypothetical protein K2X08_00900 [Chlamydiales bacterium]|nr:hypothetical protein [Chlamydiales bacterium]
MPNLETISVIFCEDFDSSDERIANIRGVYMPLQPVSLLRPSNHNGPIEIQLPNLAVVAILKSLTPGVFNIVVLPKFWSIQKVKQPLLKIPPLLDQPNLDFLALFPFLIPLNPHLQRIQMVF